MWPTNGRDVRADNEIADELFEDVSHWVLRRLSPRNLPLQRSSPASQLVNWFQTGPEREHTHDEAPRRGVSVRIVSGKERLGLYSPGRFDYSRNVPEVRHHIAVHSKRQE